jgi:hypothetical protein
MRVKIFFILFLLFSFLQLWSQATVSIKLENNTVLIGDQLKATLIVNYPKTSEISLPSFNLYWKGENIEILNISDKIAEDGPDGQQIIKQNLSLVFWDTGTYVLPKLPLNVSSSGLTDSIYTEELQVTVKYPQGLTGDSSYMAPIKPILAESKNIWDYILDYQYVILAFLSIVVLIALAYLILKYRKSVQHKKSILSPESKAKKALEELIHLDLISKGKEALYHERISWIMREYLFDRFQLKTLESTTSEIHQLLLSFDFDEKLKKELLEVLETADLVKFAKASPLPSAHQFALNLANRWIDDVLKQLEAEKKKTK